MPLRERRGNLREPQCCAEYAPRKVRPGNLEIAPGFLGYFSEGCREPPRYSERLRRDLRDSEEMLRTGGTAGFSCQGGICYPIYPHISPQPSTSGIFVSILAYPCIITKERGNKTPLPVSWKRTQLDYLYPTGTDLTHLLYIFRCHTRKSRSDQTGSIIISPHYISIILTIHTTIYSILSTIIF